MRSAGGGGPPHGESFGVVEMQPSSARVPSGAATNPTHLVPALATGATGTGDAARSEQLALAGVVPGSPTRDEGRAAEPRRVWPFGDLPLMYYRAILADPPWHFDAGGDRGPSDHYDTMSVDEIAALPVSHLAAGDCVLFMWVTDPLLPAGLEVMRAWGFDYRTVAFTWAKTRRKHGTLEVAPTDWHMGTGYWTRANPEMCLLGATGRPSPRPDATNVKQLVVAPRREHSRKPPQVHERIEALVEGPYLELFARERRPGWAAWGNDVDHFANGAPVNA